jgi:hypothetical protein
LKENGVDRVAIKPGENPHRFYFLPDEAGTDEAGTVQRLLRSHGSGYKFKHCLRASSAKITSPKTFFSSISLLSPTP